MRTFGPRCVQTTWYKRLPINPNADQRVSPSRSLARCSAVSQSKYSIEAKSTSCFKSVSARLASSHSYCIGYFISHCSHNKRRTQGQHVALPLLPHGVDVGEAEAELAEVVVGAGVDHEVLGGSVDVAHAALQDAVVVDGAAATVAEGGGRDLTGDIRGVGAGAAEAELAFQVGTLSAEQNCQASSRASRHRARAARSCWSQRPRSRCSEPRWEMVEVR